MSKLILITGISKGLGFAMTEGFIQQGHTVIGYAVPFILNLKPKDNGIPKTLS